MAAKFPLIPGQEVQNLADKLLKGLGHAVLGNFVFFLAMSSKRQIGRARVFLFQNHGHITTENDFPAV